MTFLEWLILDTIDPTLPLYFREAKDTPAFQGILLFLTPFLMIISVKNSEFSDGIWNHDFLYTSH